MKKKVILKRISAFLCALVVFVGMFAGAIPFYAASNGVEKILENLGIPLPDSYDSSYNCALWKVEGFDWYYFVGIRSDISAEGRIYRQNSRDTTLSNTTLNGIAYRFYVPLSNVDTYDYFECVYSLSSNEWIRDRLVSKSSYDDPYFLAIQGGLSAGKQYGIEANSILFNNLLYSDFDFLLRDSYFFDTLDWDVFTVFRKNSSVAEPSLGYLQNLQYYIAYERGALNNYNEDSCTEFWSFDQFTTTDLDLTAGNYTVRHYIRKVLCKSYEDDGVIEEYDKYLMGEYDAAALEFSYLRTDYDKKLEEYGYDGIGFIDAYLLGRFVLEWHYFELVDNDTGAVGGYVLMKPKDATGENFGVEYVGTTYDQDGNVDEDGYTDDVVIHGVGGGTTIDEALENAKDDSQRVDPLAGLDGFIANLQAFSVSLENVPLAIKSVIELFPGWVLALFGLSFALTFLAILVKVLRG